MADFGVFLQRCADYKGWGNEAQAMVRTVNAKQEDQSAQSGSARAVDGLASLVAGVPEEGMHGQGVGRTSAGGDSGIRLDLKRKLNKSYFAWEIKTFKDLFVERLCMVEASTGTTRPRPTPSE